MYIINMNTATTHYSRKIEMPKNRHEGLCNFVQQIINQIEAGKPDQALYTAVDLLDDLLATDGPYSASTSGPRQPMLDELTRQHALQMADAVTNARAEGLRDGIDLERSRIARMLGLQAE